MALHRHRWLSVGTVDGTRAWDCRCGATRVLREDDGGMALAYTIEPDAAQP